MKYFTLFIVLIVPILLIGFVIFSKSTDTTTNLDAAGVASALQVQADDYVVGNRDADVVVVEYVDFECPACAAYHPVINAVAIDYWDQVAFVTRHFPLIFHPNGEHAAYAVEAAAKQGKRLEMSEELFSTQASWANSASDPASFDNMAVALGVELNQFQKDRQSVEVRDKVRRQQAVGRQVGVEGTPTFFIQGEKIQNPRSSEEFGALLDAELVKADLANAGEPTHEHADMQVYVLGQQLDLSAAQYQSDETNQHHDTIHFHDGNGEMVHKHQTKTTMGEFFASIGLSVTDTCLTLDTGVEHCNDETNQLRAYVNKTQIANLAAYELSDNDQILLSYGTEAQAKAQLALVKDEACIYSKTCPERGDPPTENCVGGIGTSCVGGHDHDDPTIEHDDHE